MILNRLTTSELFNAAGATLTVLFSIVITVALVTLLGQAAGGRVDAQAVFELLDYSSYLNMPALLCLTGFVSVLMVLSRYWQDSEMVVWFTSGGVSLFRFIRPVLAFTFPLLLIVAVISLEVTPWAKAQIQRITTEFEQSTSLSQVSPGRFVEIQGGRQVFFLETIYPEKNAIENVFFSEFSNGREVIVWAKKGEMRYEPNGLQYLVLQDGRRYEASPNKDASWRITDFGQYDLRLNKAAQAAVSLNVEELSFSKLLETPNPVTQAEMAWRISWPLCLINLVLFAIPLSYVNPRVGRSIGLVLAVVSFILYLNGISLIETSIKSGTIQMMPALVLLHGSIFVVVVFYFVWRVWFQGWSPSRLLYKRRLARYQLRHKEQMRLLQQRRNKTQTGGISSMSQPESHREF